jgi:hypothetical protein
MPSVTFEPTIPEFKRAKTIYASEDAAAVNGLSLSLSPIFFPTIVKEER